jgi:hypothetical protein
MEKGIRETLERPFPRNLIRSRKGSFGKELLHVEVNHYARRLNEAFGGSWSFHTEHHETYDDEVVVLGKLIAAGIEKTAFGSSAIIKAKETGKPLSIGDDLKAAASDALKKCSSLFGIGLDLYSDPSEQGTEERQPRRTGSETLNPPPRDAWRRATAGNQPGSSGGAGTDGRPCRRRTGSG